MEVITQEHIKKVIKNGNWMVRADNNGNSPSPEANGFKWNGIGEWTEAPDFSENMNCGHGLHGQSKKCSGYICGERVVFCETDGKVIPLINKIKVRRARILMVGLPSWLEFDGNLDLSNTGITSLPDNLSVGESLYLQGTQITSLPDNLSVGGFLYLEGTQITIDMVPKHLLKKCVF